LGSLLLQTLTFCPCNSAVALVGRLPIGLYLNDKPRRQIFAARVKLFAGRASLTSSVSGGRSLGRDRCAYAIVIAYREILAVFRQDKR
jgi:hypothetical protein